jgi:hypothetical protein
MTVSDRAKRKQDPPEFESRGFGKLMIDVLQGQVQWGPHAITGWQPVLLDALACIAAHNGTISEAEVHCLVRAETKLRTMKAKIVRTLVGGGVPPEYAARLIINEFDRGVRLNPRVRATVRARAVRGAAERGGARMHDSVISSMRRAARELFGAEGLEQVLGLLPPDTRSDCTTKRLLDGSMIPVRYVTEWGRAIFNGPVEQDPEKLSRFIDLTVHYQLSATYDETALLFEQRSGDVQEVWDLLSHGGLIDLHWSDLGFELRLSKHPFVEDPFTARAFAVAVQHLARQLNFPEAQLVTFRVDVTGALSVQIAARQAGRLRATG